MRQRRFETDRTILRPIEADDAERVQELLNAPGIIGRRHMAEQIPDVAPLSRLQVEKLLGMWAEEKKGFTLGIELRQESVLVGHASCNWRWDAHCPEIGVTVCPGFQREGVGSEVVRLLLAYLFGNTPAHNVGGWVEGWNNEGIAFARSLGFSESGRIPRCGIRDGTFFEQILFDILRPEWRAWSGGSRGA